MKVDDVVPKPKKETDMLQRINRRGDDSVGPYNRDRWARSLQKLWDRR